MFDENKMLFHAEHKNRILHKIFLHTVTYSIFFFSVEHGNKTDLNWLIRFYENPL